MIGFEVIIGGIVAAILAVVGAFGLGNYRGGKSEKTKQQAKEANEYVEARKRADEAERNAGGGSWSDRLRNHRDKQ